MSRTIRELLVRDYEKRFRDVSELAVVSTQGIDVGRVTALRRSLREKGLQAMVVRNRLCRRALGAVGLDAAGELLEGPSALVWGGEGIVEIAKTLVAEAKALAELQIRGGYSDGRVISSGELDALAKLPSREELLGQVVGRTFGQAARVAAMAMSPARQVAAQMREIEKRSPEAKSKTPAEAKAEDAQAESETNQAGGAETHASPDTPGPAEEKDSDTSQESDKA